MKPNRKLWNDGQQKLRRALTENDYLKAKDQFLIQHAMVHILGHFWNLPAPLICRSHKQDLYRKDSIS